MLVGVAQWRYSYSMAIWWFINHCISSNRGIFYGGSEKRNRFSYGRPFVSKLWHDIRAVFSHVFLQSFPLWSAICFKIMTRYMCGFFPRILAIIPATRYTCVFLPRILAFFPALWGFYSQVYDHFLTNAHIYAHKKAHIYVLQTSMWYMRSQKVVV